MNVLRKLRRPRWLVTIACIAVLAPLAFVVSGVASAGKTAVTSQAAPVVDRDYIYGQLFDMAYNDVYRISGADGPPTSPNSPWNVASTINGWQEFFQHWKDQLTDKSVMTNMAKFATVSDHYFQRSPDLALPSGFGAGAFPWPSDDAEVTVPGETCAGQRVLLAAHPDGTPVTTDIVGEVNNPTLSTSAVFGFGAARRHITLSNLGNGGAYDDTSGVTLTMGEYQALMRWYTANNTYPAKTLKVALLDAEAGRAADGTYRREGSQYYANNLIPTGPQGQYLLFANMDANGMSYPAYHLGTQYYWNNINGGGVGPWFTFIKQIPAAPNAIFPNTGVGSPGANILANNAAITQFQGDFASAVSAGFAAQGAKYSFSVPQENPLRYTNSGSAPSPAIPTPIVSAYTPAQQAQYSPIRDDSDGIADEQAFFNLGIPGFTVGGVKDSNIDENPYVSTVSAAIRATPVIQYAGNGTAFELASNVPSAGMTTTNGATAIGATTVTVASGTNLLAGDPFFVDTGANLERGRIVSVAGTTVTVTPPLKNAHATAVPFNVNEGQPVGYTADTLEHLNFFASGAPHGVAGETTPTEELLRALELPATYTSLLLSGPDYLGAVAKPTGNVAYFETDPVKPTTTSSVKFDASFSRDKSGTTNGLQYYWDFGDGSHSTGMTVTHNFSAPIYADVKLVVVKGSSFAYYRQAVAVNSPATAAPATSPCGTLTASEQATLKKAAQAAFRGKPAAAKAKD